MSKPFTLNLLSQLKLLINDLTKMEFGVSITLEESILVFKKCIYYTYKAIKCIKTLNLTKTVYFKSTDYPLKPLFHHKMTHI